MIEINYLAMLVAAIAAYAVGALWYSPVGFGKYWMKLSGIDPENVKHMGGLTPTQSMALGFVFTLLIAYVMAHFVELLNVEDLQSALTLGFWSWLGFGFTTLAHGWLYEGKSLKLFLFNAAHLLVAFLVMAAVLGLWQ